MENNIKDKILNFIHAGKSFSDDNYKWYCGEVRDYKINKTRKWQHSIRLPLVDYYVNQVLINILSNYNTENKKFCTLLSTSDDYTQLARQYETVLLYYLDRNDFISLLKKAVLDALVYGIGILKVNFVFDSKHKNYYDIINNEVKEVEEEIEDFYPRISLINPINIVIKEEDGEVIEVAEVYKSLRSDVVLKALANIDINDTKIARLISEIEEDKTYDLILWTNGTRNICLLNNEIVYDKPSAYKSNKINYFFFSFISSSRTRFAKSLIDVMRGSIEHIEELTNLAADNALLSALQIYALRSTSAKGKAIDGELEPGKIVKVNSTDEIKPLFMGAYNATHLTEIQQHLSMINNLVGAITPMAPNDLGSTATEARLNVALMREKATNLVDELNKKTLVPLLRFVIEVIQQYSPVLKEDMAKILNLKNDNELLINEKSDIDLNTTLSVDISLKDKNILRTSELEKLNQLAVFFNSLANVPEGVKDILINKILSLFDITLKKEDLTPQVNPADMQKMLGMLTQGAPVITDEQAREEIAKQTAKGNEMLQNEEIAKQTAKGEE